ncbi:MAG TPA: hypothetical protein VK553_07715 [Candidatus Nitrosopolaris rasttigaisensis]|nr:hypothetical protein [Candidatus Nitrosopolaris rasttigaisensis]
MTAVTRTAIVANSIINTEVGLAIRRLIDTLVFIHSVTLVIHSSNVSNSPDSNPETTRSKRNARENVLEKIISIIKLIAIVILANCPRCGKRIVKWFETWYAQGNCSCLSVENKTIGTRDEEY